MVNIYGFDDGLFFFLIVFLGYKETSILFIIILCSFILFYLPIYCILTSIISFWSSKLCDFPIKIFFGFVFFIIK